MDSSQAVNPEELFDRARRGDKDALGQILNLYRPYLALLARLHKNPQLQSRVADSDFVQETALLAHRDFCQFQGVTEKEFTAWLRQLMAHVGANLLRNHKRRRRDMRREKRLYEVFDQSSQVVGQAFIQHGSTPSERVVRRERAVLLSQALSELPADYREVLVLREMEGMSLRGFSQHMGRSENAVRKLWARAIIQMRQLMQGDTDIS